MLCCPHSLHHDPAKRYTADELLRHPYLVNCKSVTPIYSDTRAGLEECEEIMEVAVQKIRLKPKHFTVLSGQLGLEEKVVAACWEKHQSMFVCSFVRLFVCLFVFFGCLS